MSAGPAVKNEIRVHDRFPLLLIEFSGAPDDAQFAAYIAEMEAVAGRGAARPLAHALRTAVLFDTTDATRPVTASQRKMQADFMRRMKVKYPESTHREAAEVTAVCFVITNMLVRGVLTAILWLQPMRERYKVCATRAEADVWCRRWVVGMASLPPAELGHG